MKYIGLFDEKEDIVTKEKLDAVEAAIPTKTSQLDNDSGFITSAPVTSVNTKIGAVTLSASDVGAQPTITVNGIIKGDGAGDVTIAKAGVDYATPSLGLTGTTIGQVPAVKTIDEQGKPTQWEAATLPEQVQADWNQNNSSVADYVKNRTHYEESIYADYVLNMSGTVIEGLSMPEVGETMTVKINGVESAETVKEAESSILGSSYKYIGNIDVDSLLNGGTGWAIADIDYQTGGFANPDTTITVESLVVHKINDKFINFDGFVRTFDYHFKDYTIYKTLYNDDGDKCLLYRCNNFILPKMDSQLFGFMGEIGFSQVGSGKLQSCYVLGCIISSTNGSITIQRTVLGTDTTEMEELAAGYGFTHTTNPKA